MFSSRSAPKTLKLPSHPGQTITVRKISWRHYRQAIGLILEGRTVEANLLILTHGIVAWSPQVVLSPETIADLEDEPAQFVLNEILKLTKPELFAGD